MGFTFTPSQRRAIEDHGGAILVSAAAGSGKTRILTERLLRSVTDPEAPVDIDRFLVITYTRAAAAELRNRILESLSREAAARPEDRRLRRQQTLCCRAHIGTIHSFCTEVIRENCHLLGLPPAFRVADAQRADALRRAALTRLLEKRYQRIAEDPSFRLLADTVGYGRDDRRLEETVLRLHEKLRSHPDPEQWAEAQKRALRAEGASDAGQTPWGRELLAAARSDTAYQIQAMESMIAELDAAGGALARAYVPPFTDATEALRGLLRALDTGWEAARARCDIPFRRLGATRGELDLALRERAKAVWERCKKTAEKLQACFSQDSAAALEEQRATAPAMAALLDLALELDKSFTADKLRRGLLDFSDLEHYALQLLRARDGAPTAVARELSRRFAEILVDEYQDCSPIQDALFQAVSRAGQNLFLVGDVKQSIYRFRLADPGLFLEKYRRFARAEEAAEGQPRRILLHENFRSRKAVLDAANQVFSAIMSEELGELRYDVDAALKYGATIYDSAEDAPVELAVLDAGQEEPEEGLFGEKQVPEAVYVARRIQELMDAGTPVTTPEGTRRCAWGDFVILLRAPGGSGPVYQRVLAERGIPVAGRSAGGFFTSLEITVAVNLLSLIDNPHADIPLISVLRSPVFCFTADALSLIRTQAAEGDFYTAVQAAAAAGDGACAGFLALLASWRALAADLEPDELLRRVCNDTGLPALCAAMEEGETRRKNLTRLFDYAREFSGTGYRGVHAFVGWLQRLAESGMEPEPPAEENAVRILSIHRSKGLEFPFVFLCELGHAFNRTDARDAVLLHTELGLGPKYVNTELGVEYPTLARRAIAQRLTTEMLSEEMRVLYVGMTRAREKLIMTCTLRKAEETLDRLRETAVRPVPPAVLRGASCPAQWLLPAALTADGGGIRVTLAAADTPGAPPPSPEAEAAAQAVRDSLVRTLEANLAFAYPYAGSVDLPSRLTATELKGSEPADFADPEAAPLPLPSSAAPEPTTQAHRLNTQANRLHAQALWPNAEAPMANMQADMRASMPRVQTNEPDVTDPMADAASPEPAAAGAFRPVDLGQPHRLSAAERGTATHSFLQYLDFQAAGTPEGLRGELERLTGTGRLSREEAAVVDLGAVHRLFASPLGQAIRRAKDLRREFRFTLLTPASSYAPKADAEDLLLLQGVVDLFFVENGRITVVDYKTDRVTAAEAPRRAEHYRPQLEAYAGALHRITGLPVEQSVLWFLRPAVEVPLTPRGPYADHS